MARDNMTGGGSSTSGSATTGAGADSSTGSTTSTVGVDAQTRERVNREVNTYEEEDSRRESDSQRVNAPVNHTENTRSAPQQSRSTTSKQTTDSSTSSSADSSATRGVSRGESPPSDESGPSDTTTATRGVRNEGTVGRQPEQLESTGTVTDKEAAPRSPSSDTGVVDGFTSTVDNAGDAITGAAEATYDGASTVGDFAAGNTDEAVGRAVESAKRGDVAGTADHLAGNTDEATNTVVEGTQDVAVDTVENTQRVAREVSEGDLDAAGDAAAGNFDESVGRNAEAYGPGLDVIAGDTDEAVGRAVESAKRGDVAGTADALAGSTDEAAGTAVEKAKQGDVAGVTDATAGRLDEATHGVVESTDDVADAAAGSTDEAVGRAVEEAKQGDVAAAGDELAGGLDEGVGNMAKAGRRAAGELAEGDLAGAADEAAGRIDESTNRVATAVTQTDTAVEFQAVLGDEAVGHLDEQMGGGFQRTATEAATSSGGFLNESEEQKLKTAAEEFSRDVKATGELAEGTVDEVDTEGGLAGEVTQGGVEGLGGLANVFAGAGGAETAAEIAGNVDDKNAAALVKSGAALGGSAAYKMYNQATGNPGRFLGAILGEAAAGFGAGKLAKAAGPTGKIGSRIRTVRRTELSESMARESVETGDRKYPAFSEQADADQGGIDDETWTELQDTESFPAEPSTDPVEEIQNLADEHTPPELQQRAGDATVMKHVTPEGDFVDQDKINVEGGADYDTEGLYTGPDLFTDIKGVASKDDTSFVDYVKAETTPQRPSLPSPAGLDVNLRNIGSEDPVIDVADPAVGTLQVENMERMPEWISSKEDANRFLEQQGEAGTAYVRNSERITSEAEAIVPKDTAWMKVGDDYRTDVRGTKLPVNEYAPVDQSVIEDVTGKTGQEAIDAFEEKAGTEVTTDVPEGYRGGNEPENPYLPTPGVGETTASTAGATGEQRRGPAETGGVDVFGVTGRTVDEFGIGGQNGPTTSFTRTRDSSTTDESTTTTEDTTTSTRDRTDTTDDRDVTTDTRDKSRDDRTTGRTRDETTQTTRTRDRTDERTRDEPKRPRTPSRPEDRDPGRDPDRPRTPDTDRPRIPDRAEGRGRDRDRRGDGERDRRRDRDRDRRRLLDNDRQRHRRDDDKRKDEPWLLDQVTSQVDHYDVGFRNPIASGASVLFGGVFGATGEPNADPTARFDTGGIPGAGPELGAGAPEAGFGFGGTAEGGVEDVGTIDFGPAPESGSLPAWWDEATRGERQ